VATTIAIDDAAVVGLLKQLPRAALLGHSGRSFLEHLLCTWRILVDWRMPRAVCRAGFMHSAYSTSFYHHALFPLDQRATLRQMIGREAEDLAFRFCTMDRRAFWDRLVSRGDTAMFSYPDRLRSGAPVRVDRKTLSRLLIIESANIAEQSKAADGAPAPWMSRVLHWWDFLDDRSVPRGFRGRPALTRRADENAIEAYRTALTLPATRAAGFVDHAIEQNPWAGEPRILRALCRLGTGKSIDAGCDAVAGADLLSAWAVSWDKRLSANAWKALAAKIQMASRQRTSPRLDYRWLSVTLARPVDRPKWLNV
jgi:hypothetical protein